MKRSELRQIIKEVIKESLEYTPKDIEDALKKIEDMDQYTMCKLWRYAPTGSEIYFRSDLPTGEAFKNRLFKHFGGFTPEISKSIGWTGETRDTGNDFRDNFSMRESLSTDGILTLDDLKNMEPETVFASGEVPNSPQGIYMTNNDIGRKLLWAAKRGGIHDWCIYIHWSDMGMDFVLRSGDKVMDEKNIKKLVPCDNEAFKMYRY